MIATATATQPRKLDALDICERYAVEVRMPCAYTDGSPVWVFARTVSQCGEYPIAMFSTEDAADQFVASRHKTDTTTTTYRIVDVHARLAAYVAQEGGAA